MAEINLFWNLAESAAGNTEFNAGAQWLEAYALPGLRFNRHLQSGASVFGSISAAASCTAGTDAFDAGNTGRMTREEAYIGYRTALPDHATKVTRVKFAHSRFASGASAPNLGC